MVDSVQAPQKAVAVDNDDREKTHPGVSADRMERFRSAMIAASLRAPMVSLAGANGEPEDDHVDPPTIPMKAPVIPPTTG